jgi:TPR repeat protein
MSSLHTSYSAATEKFAAGEFAAALDLFRRLALTEMPEAWLQVARCHEFLRESTNAGQAIANLRTAADSGHPAASFAMHLFLRETADPFATGQKKSESRRYLRFAASSGYPPAVEQLAVDRRLGLEPIEGRE